MLQMVNHEVQARRVLRCLWVPAHMGENAPLHAVWVESTEAEESKEEVASVPVEDPPLLSRAA